MHLKLEFLVELLKFSKTTQRWAHAALAPPNFVVQKRELDNLILSLISSILPSGQRMTEAQHNRPTLEFFGNRSSASAAEVFGETISLVIYI